MFNARTSLILLLLGSMAACTPTADDPDLGEPTQALGSDQEPEVDALALEQAGGRLPSAPTSLLVDHAERERIEHVRASSCARDHQGHAPHDDLAIELAEGLVDPRVRVHEDQRQAALDFAPEDEPEPAFDAPEVDPGIQRAQAHYLAEAEALEAEFTGTRAELAEARAELKEAELGE